MLRADANGKGQGATRNSTPFVLVLVTIAIGASVHFLFEMDRESESCGNFEKAQNTSNLIYFRDFFLRGRSVRGSEEFQKLGTTGDAGGEFELSIRKRGVVGKGHPEGHAGGVRFFGGEKEAAAGDVDGFANFGLVAHEGRPTEPYWKTKLGPVVLAGGGHWGYHARTGAGMTYSIRREYANG